MIISPGNFIISIFFIVLIMVPIYVFIYADEVIEFKKCRFQSETVIECLWLLSK